MKLVITMRIYLLALFFLCSIKLAFTQNLEVDSDSISNKVIDYKYKEDQFYFAVHYNLLADMPKDMSQNGFSAGLSLGFIKDIPINSNRNFGFGLGLGISSNSINQNLRISEVNQEITFNIISADEFTKNKFSYQLVEVPFELRWRTSTTTEYKFWRVYSGFKVGHVIASRAKYNGLGNSEMVTNLNDNLNLWQFGLTLSAGYSTWNINMYYGLNSIFNNKSKVNGVENSTRLIKIGLIFYLL